MLRPQFAAARHDVVVLSRNPQGSDEIQWDGKTVGPWADAFEGVDAVINLAGRSVNCRYTEANLREMMDSRVVSTRVVGQAISGCKRPPRVWLQASTATIYAHRFDAANDEATGILGGNETGSAQKWNHSTDIAKAWEREQDRADTPNTRKVAMRTAIAMGVVRGSAFDLMAGLAQRGLGGAVAGGKQFVSWVHETDLARAILFLIDHSALAGHVNIASPNPLPNREFARALRQAVGAKAGLPATRWMLELAAVFMKTEGELMLKSRRVVPTRLLTAGFRFEYPEWPGASAELALRWRAMLRR